MLVSVVHLVSVDCFPEHERKFLSDQFSTDLKGDLISLGFHFLA